MEGRISIQVYFPTYCSKNRRVVRCSKRSEETCGARQSFASEFNAPSGVGESNLHKETVPALFSKDQGSMNAHLALSADSSDLVTRKQTTLEHWLHSWTHTVLRAYFKIFINTVHLILSLMGTDKSQQSPSTWP